MSACRHLLVDGSNILNAWPDLRAMLGRDRDAARAQLVRRLASIHDGESTRVTVVFDGKGPELSVDFPLGQETLAMVFTPSGTTADDVIEQMVAKSPDPTACSVATDDRAERETAGAAGAVILSAADLQAWVIRSVQRQTQAVADLQAKANRGWMRTP